MGARNSLATVGVAIGHLFSPWNWRRRRHVVALAVAFSVLWLLGLVMALVHRDVRGWLFNGISGLLIAVWPSVRSVRRWDRHHTSPPPPWAAKPEVASRSAVTSGAERRNETCP